MIKVENIDVWGFKHAVRGARNPLNSWHKSDSGIAPVADENGYFTKAEFRIGKNDLDLMQRLYKAGTEHRKYARQIFVSMDITAPLYWISEFDTYKIGVTRNSCSFMHRGVSKPFEITDFSIHDERVYEVLSPIEKKEYLLHYPYETNEYKLYIGENGRNYRVYKNGRIIAEEFEYIDTMNRHRILNEKECIPSQTRHGYYEVNLGGKMGNKWMLHRLVATLWIDNPDNLATVNHIDGDKGNNSVENLEWCSLSDNIKIGFQNGLFENGKSLHALYLKWKNAHIVVNPDIKMQILYDHNVNSLTCRELGKKYDITIKQANHLISQHCSNNQELFYLCYVWEKIVCLLNELRDVYLDTKNEQIFQQIRCLLPCGYNQKFTVTMNYENVFNIINQRQGHKLSEWQELCKILKGLPYIKEIAGYEEE